MLWVDAVGGYWVCLGDKVTLGQPNAQGTADVPILGDLSSRHACILRDGEGYLVEAWREVRVNGRLVQDVGWLGDGARLQLGGAVRLLFRRPHPLSATARLDFVSRHRTQPSTDSVLLMADACVLGPKPHSHVVCRDWTSRSDPVSPRAGVVLPHGRPVRDRRRRVQRRTPNHQEFPHRGRWVFVQFGGDTIEYC